jgi:spore germination cell wall hydrolase CwlJ-like protein
MSAHPITDTDLLTMAKTIYGEARGEPHLGQIAVGYVILNRSQRPGRFGTGLAAVCTRRAQFSCWNSSDPNCAILLGLTWEDAVAQHCLRAALSVLSGAVPDPTYGATHYHAVGIVPAWAKGRTARVKIGHHLFYTDIP